MPVIGGKTVHAPSQFVIKRLPQTDDELWWMVQALWGIKIPRTPVCRGHRTPFEAFADAYFGRFPVSVWKASRGYGGKSYLLATLAQTEAVLWGAQISLLGGSGAQSLNVHAHTQELWGHFNAPKSLLSSDPTKYDTFLSNGGHIRSLMASQTSVRGPHPQRLRLDEIDEMDLDILEAAQGQPMRKMRNGVMVETQTVMSSTHQYPDKTMSIILNRAKEKNWPVYEWCYKETSNPVDGWLTQDEVERKRQEIPAAMWETEYDLQEPNFNNRSIDGAALELAFSRLFGEFDGESPIVVVKPEVAGGGFFVTGVDWAKQKDQTIVATFQVVEGKYRCVAWQKMNRLPWQAMVQKAVRQWLNYGGKFIHDATGIGNVVDDLVKEIAPPNMHRHITSYVMTGGGKRAALFSEYIAAIEQQAIIYPRIDYAFDEHRYVTDDDLYGNGHVPDSIVAGALAWSLRAKKKRGGLVLPVNIDKTSHWR